MLKNINILNELKELDAAVLSTTDNKNYYTVPNNYFEELADQIHANIFIRSIPVSNPYTVSEHYFANFPELVVETIQLYEALNLSAVNKNIGLSVPNGYFENLAGNIINRIKNYSDNDVIQELEELSPLLSSIPKTNVYSVPDNYFSEFNPSHEKPTEQEEETKVISIGSHTRKWINYAAAACVGAVLFGGGYLYFNKNKNQPQNVPNSYAAAYSNMDIQKEISSLSDDAISSYLNANSNMAVYTNFNDADQMPSMDVQTMLQNVSDEEIQQYLNQSPEEGETGGGS
ncbi:MAG: hypothetical protein JST21_16975 [Bacteroidetes bacterium]|nr:hypothetical protein [Bacteroidota bacterium]